MKQFLSVLFFCAIVNIAFAGNPLTSNDNTAHGSQSRLFNIDMLDTVVFDISQASIVGNQVSFPVYILTDDTVNALDFSLVFNETNFSLDTIINLTAYLQPVYNLTMGTLYFTSYSLQEIEHNTSLLSIRLNMLGHYLCSDDLDSILVYLNGDACSTKVIECLNDGISESNKNQSHLDLYPNPVSGYLHVASDVNANIEVSDLRGAGIIYHSYVTAGQDLQINTAGMAPGVYSMKLSNADFVSVKKFIVE